MKLSQKLDLKQIQRIELSKIMLMNLIQTPNTELSEVINKEIEDNPALEIDYEAEKEPENVEEQDSPTSENDGQNDYDTNTDDWDSSDFERFQFSRDDVPYERPIVMTNSFRESLLLQIGEMNITEKEKEIANYIVGNLDDDGYLRRENQSIANDLLVQYNITTTTAEIEKIIVSFIQQLEPAGVGARDLRECLLIQLRQLQHTDNDIIIENAISVIDNYFTDYSKKKYDKILKQEKISNLELSKIHDLIRKLDPSPGGGAVSSKYITPDFLITIEEDRPVLSLNNPYIPKLRINKEYLDLYQLYRSKKNKEAMEFIKKNIDNANSFISALPERDRTMYLIMNEILKYQERFFLTGDSKQLKPMVLKNIAEKVGVDNSTVSRVTGRRYVQTPFGTILLKSLFSEAVNDEDGVSSNAIKQALTELIDKEDKSKPYTDEKLSELLKKRGYNISRRTVAKYREQLNISATSIRKQ